MSEQTIYKALRDGGLSHNGACAVMGNMYHESLLRSNNVEDRCTLSDDEYTAAVDEGRINAYTWSRDAFGYGLCQWTYWSRKEALLSFAVTNGVSVGDEQMQCRFCIMELIQDYQGLYNFLCSDSADLHLATDRFCREYERPAYNNVNDRYQKAVAYCSSLKDTEDCDNDDTCPIDFGSTESCQISVRVLRNGDKGRDVFMAQCGLNDMGDDCGIPDGVFGSHTESAVNDLKERAGLPADGIIDADVWQILFQ